MSGRKKQFIVEILKKMDLHSIFPDMNELGIVSESEYFNVFEIMKSDGLVSGSIVDGDIKITIKGIEYLEKRDTDIIIGCVRKKYSDKNLIHSDIINLFIDSRIF